MKKSTVTYPLLLPLVMAVCPVLSISCSTDSMDDAEPIPIPQLIVMYAPGGLGDQGYNDRILTGVQQFKKAHYSEVEIYQYSPGSADEAARLLGDWLALPESTTRALFVAASSDYDDLVADKLGQQSLTPNKQLLLFESDNVRNLPICTFRLSMYGASYLAGFTASRLLNCGSDALIVLAHPGDATIAKAEKGFREGLRDAGAEGVPFTEYLADDWSGYVAAQSAYRRMDLWAGNYDFIFPVAGGSNQGIYRYTREYPDAPLTAGMDIDRSGLSRNIIGSVIKQIDQVVYNYLEQWLVTGRLPEDAAVFGLESGYTDWVLSPDFSQYQPDVDAVREKAVRMEEDL